MINRFHLRTVREPPIVPVLTWLRSGTLARWYDRYLQRIDLAEIDDHLLRDLGLTPEDVRRECAKSFWRP